MDFTDVMLRIVAVAVPLVFAVTLHEAAHGWAASCLGDQTAKEQGRVTLNPLRHIDPVGTIILPVIMLVISSFNFMFGWAKPVPVDWRNLGDPRRDMALVALAGPLANLLMALGWGIFLKLFWMSGNSEIGLINSLVRMIGVYGILINCLLLVINLIPVPPLDGSRIISALLPSSMAYHYGRLEPYGIWIMIGVIYLFGQQLLNPPVTMLFKFITSILGLQ